MRLQILMPTFNGAEYLPALVASLRAQTFQDFELLVHDDGSSDGTLRVLAGADFGRTAVVRAQPHIGLPGSYFRLLAHSSPEAEFVAFCDQDDVWLPEKMARAIAALTAGDPTRPTLYCSRLRLVDAQLRDLQLSRRPQRPLGFANALVENCATGCTIVLNRAARELLLQATPRAALMHDHWAYLVISALGRIHYDPSPQVLYRQHPRNTIGGTASWARRFWSLRHAGWRSQLLPQALEFASLYSERLDAQRRTILERFLEAMRDGRARIAYAARPDVYRQGTADDLALRVLIAAGLW